MRLCSTCQLCSIVDLFNDSFLLDFSDLGFPPSHPLLGNMDAYARSTLLLGVSEDELLTQAKEVALFTLSSALGGATRNSWEYCTLSFYVGGSKSKGREIISTLSLAFGHVKTTLCMQAMVASSSEAHDMEEHIQNLDQDLQAKLRGVQVPGHGDCQYLSLIESAKKQGMDLGGPADVRIQVCQGLLANKDRYLQFWDETWGSYDEWARQQLVGGTWGDDFTLQVSRCHVGVVHLII